MTGEARTVGLLLAAGAGTRLGMPKILVAGWLRRAVDALQSGGCSTVAVVTGAARPSLPQGVLEIYCPEWERGIGASLQAGLTSALWADRVVIHLVDTPDIESDVVRRVLRVCGGNLGRAIYAGRPGHPVVIPAAHFAALLEALRDNDGAGPYLRAHDHIAVECGDLATGRDIDSLPGLGPLWSNREPPGGT